MSNANNSAMNHVTLPPISSFDNLIKAAERQYSGEASSASAHPALPNMNISNGSGSAGASSSMLSYQLLPHSNDVSRSNSSSSFLPSAQQQQQQQPADGSTSASETSSSASPSRSISPPLKMAAPSSAGGGGSGSTPHSIKINKPRKKKQCPICRNFYANLTTHKATHLTPEDRPHKCPICHRGFARNNDLLRHKKRHWKDEILSQSGALSSPANDVTGGSVSPTDDDTHEKMTPMNSVTDYAQLKSLHQIKGTFKCPFNSTLIQLDMDMYPYKFKPLNFETSNCHQTGVFSRCDTFKNHLKALHFEYPPGTKKKDRNIVPGRCKHCGLKFENVDVWLNEHVGKQCGYKYH
ncbi:hypothetical protein SUVZ_12G4010 [Saccharomyces uvarum]|uniref:C2H2-type domain-containing protein n=1 Tax=Saccharomyces uvarum TaxID=230603 RepID=A0ABN8WHG7_SACUV|nr:hypothetical protein SUVZ_12G4010 [Saccharomyces uvarum]